MTINDCYEVGYIQKTHGIKGEVMIVLDVDNPDDYEEMDSIFIEIKSQLVPFFIEQLNLLSEKAIVKFEEINHIDKAKELVGSKLYLPLDTLDDLEEGQFYYHDVIGYTVNDKKLGLLSEINNFYELPQYAVLTMIHEGREVMIPIIDSILLNVDHEKKEIITELPEGLLDVYLNNSDQDDGFDD